MDSEKNLADFSAAGDCLGSFLQKIDEKTSIVLIPAKFQVSEQARQLARSIMGPQVPEDEFSNLLEINRHRRQWLQSHFPQIRVLDLAARMDTASQYYCTLDSHFTPAGADLVVREML